MKKKLRSNVSGALVEDRRFFSAKESLEQLHPKHIRKLFFLAKQGRAGDSTFKKAFQADMVTAEEVKQPFLQDFLRKFFQQHQCEVMAEEDRVCLGETLVDIEGEQERQFLRNLKRYRSPLLDAMWKDSISRASIVRGEAFDVPDLKLHVPVEAVSVFTLHWFRSHVANSIQKLPQEVSSKKLLSIIQAQLANKTEARTSLAIQHISRKLLDKVCSSLGSVFLHLKTVSFCYGEAKYTDVILNLSSFEAIRGLLWLDYIDEGRPLGAQGCEVKLKCGDPLMRQFCLQTAMGIISVLPGPASSALLAKSVLEVFQYLLSEEIVARIRKRSLEPWQDVSWGVLQEMSGSQIRPWMEKQALIVAVFLSDVVLWSSCIHNDCSFSCVQWLQDALSPKKSVEGTVTPFTVFMYLVQERFPATTELTYIEQVEYGIYSFLLHCSEERNVKNDWLLHVWVKEIVKKCNPITRLAHSIRDEAEASYVQNDSFSYEISRSLLLFALGYGIFHGTASFRSHILSETTALIRVLRTLPFKGKDPLSCSGSGLLSRVITLIHSLTETFFLFFEEPHFIMLRKKMEQDFTLGDTSPKHNGLEHLSQRSLRFYQKLHYLIRNEPLALQNVEDLIKEEPIYQVVVEQEICSSHKDNYLSN